MLMYLCAEHKCVPVFPLSCAKQSDAGGSGGGTVR